MYSQYIGDACLIGKGKKVLLTGAEKDVVESDFRDYSGTTSEFQSVVQGGQVFHALTYQRAPNSGSTTYPASYVTTSLRPTSLSYVTASHLDLTCFKSPVGRRPPPIDITETFNSNTNKENETT